MSTADTPPFIRPTQPILPPEPTVVERWNAARQLIEREHTIINHRLTWAAAIQGGILVVFGAAAKGYTDKPDSVMLLAGCIALSLIGATTNWLFVADLSSHAKAIEKAESYWNDQKCDTLPPLTHAPEHTRRFSLLRPNLWYFPPFVTGCWLLAVVILLLDKFHVPLST